MWLVHKLAVAIRRDLRGTATLALYEAAARFDPTRGVPFSAFARTWVRPAIRRYLRNEDRWTNGRVELWLGGDGGTPGERPRAPAGASGDNPSAIADGFADTVADPRDAHTLAARRRGNVEVLWRAEAAAELHAARRKLHALTAPGSIDRDIALTRVLTREPDSLAEVGKRWGYSHEYVRRREVALRARLAEVRP